MGKDPIVIKGLEVRREGGQPDEIVNLVDVEGRRHSYYDVRYKIIESSQIYQIFSEEITPDPAVIISDKNGVLKTSRDKTPLNNLDGLERTVIE